jgi:hypothetical protein
MATVKAKLTKYEVQVVRIGYAHRNIVVQGRQSLPGIKRL